MSKHWWMKKYISKKFGIGGNPFLEKLSEIVTCSSDNINDNREFISSLKQYTTDIPDMIRRFSNMSIEIIPMIFMENDDLDYTLDVHALLEPHLKQHDVSEMLLSMVYTFSTANIKACDGSDRTDELKEMIELYNEKFRYNEHIMDDRLCVLCESCRYVLNTVMMKYEIYGTLHIGDDISRLLINSDLDYETYTHDREDLIDKVSEFTDFDRDVISKAIDDVMVVMIPQVLLENTFMLDVRQRKFSVARTKEEKKFRVDTPGSKDIVEPIRLFKELKQELRLEWL